MCEEHLDLLAFVARPFELGRIRHLTRVVASLFMDAAQNIAHRGVWTAAGLEFTTLTVSFAGPVFPVSTADIVGAREREVATILHEQLAGGTGELVVDRIEDEVRAAEGPVITLAIIPDRNVRRDALIDEPAEELPVP